MWCSGGEGSGAVIPGAGKSGAGREVNGDRSARRVLVDDHARRCRRRPRGQAFWPDRWRAMALAVDSVNTGSPCATPPGPENPCSMRISRLARGLHSQARVQGGGRMKRHPRATEDRPERLLKLNTILPDQFFSPRDLRGWSGEQRLMAAILVDALAVYSKRDALSRSEGGYVLRQTLHWLRSNDRTSACSFVRVCEVLGLEPDAVRRHLDDGGGEAARGRSFTFARLKSPRRLVGG